MLLGLGEVDSALLTRVSEAPSAPNLAFNIADRGVCQPTIFVRLLEELDITYQSLCSSHEVWISSQLQGYASSYVFHVLSSALETLVVRSTSAEDFHYLWVDDDYRSVQLHSSAEHPRCSGRRQ
jgi:hypothetical protein